MTNHSHDKSILVIEIKYLHLGDNDMGEWYIDHCKQIIRDEEDFLTQIADARTHMVGELLDELEAHAKKNIEIYKRVIDMESQ